MNKIDLETTSAKLQILAALIGMIVALFTLITVWLPNAKEKKTRETTEYKTDRPEEKTYSEDKKEKKTKDTSTEYKTDRTEINKTSPKKKHTPEEEKEKNTRDTSTEYKTDRTEINKTSPKKKHNSEDKIYPEDEKLNNWRNTKPKNINLKPKKNE